jgi:hypothetical protein
VCIVLFGDGLSSLVEQRYIYLLIPERSAIVCVNDPDCHGLSKAHVAPRKEGSEDQISKKEPHITVTLLEL